MSFMSRLLVQRIRVFIVLVLFLSLGVMYQPGFAQTTPQNDAVKAAEVLALVNAWRVGEGLWPLAINPELERLALAQATYVLPILPSINNESAYHVDAQGRDPRQRAYAAQWPIYGADPNRIEIGENAGVGTIAFALKFWQESEIHRRAALSTVYREVGVAVLPRPRGGYFIIMEFGARPDVLPVLLDASGRRLYLTDERSRYGGWGAGTQIRLFGTNGTPLTGVIPWQPMIDVPGGASDKLFVLYTNGQKQSLREVRLAQDYAVLPETLSIVGAGNISAANPTSVPVTRAPDTVAATIPATIVPASSPTVVAVQPTATPLPAATSTPVAVVASGVEDVVLVYTRNALVLLNSSSTPVDLRGLTIGGAAGSVTAERWAQVSGFPVEAFPAGHCLKVQQGGTNDASPSTCRFVRSVIDVSAGRVFWSSGTFTVQKNGVTLANCEASAGRCGVDLP